MKTLFPILDNPRMKSFFEAANFSFGKKDSDIKPIKIVLSENEELSKKLEGNVFIYDSPTYAETSFYVITIPLKKQGLFEIKRFIWNEDKCYLYFLPEKPNSKLLTTLYYAKSDPYEKESNIKIASFSGDKEDIKELEKIKKWRFESGAFWLAYADFLKKVEKSTRIDEKLVKQLKNLRLKLKNTLKTQLNNPDVIVQALIDRTLFIKFLEDKHIINSYFYHHHFPNRFTIEDNDFGFKALLKECDIAGINKLFDEINKLFNNVLFWRENPHIEEKYLTKDVLTLIYEAIRQYNWETRQLSLFDFRFDVIPIEFISHIYEVFLDDKQLDEGIYYTPPKLAHLIIDDTITGLGSILDPSCGSGMFLILAFRKLLEYSPLPKDMYAQIKHKNDLLKKYIFGIEKQNTAWRLSIFSLYLEILRDLPANEIKELIKQKLENNSIYSLFEDFSANILERNALEIAEDNKPHYCKTFDFIVGNPPFFKIKSTDKEFSFLNHYETEINGEKITAKIIGDYQISQAFMLKIKDWAKSTSRFGFVQNSSNFYNEKSENFRNFFFRNYQIENFYELSRVKKILFRKPKEGVVVTIFNNLQFKKNTFNYYPVHLGVFSEKFDLLIIQEDKKIEILQKDIVDEKIILRDYLISNEYDLKLLKKISAHKKLEEFLLKDDNYTSFRGLERTTNVTITKYFKISTIEFNKLERKEKLKLQQQFAEENYLSTRQNHYHNIPFIYEPKNISNFKVDFEGYVNEKDLDKSFFQRVRNKFIYKSGKILFGRHGNKLEATFVNQDAVFSTRIYGIKLQNENYYNLFTALFNSELVNYYLHLKFRKRVNGNFSKLDLTAIKNIPIPKYIDEDIASEISELSHQLHQGELEYKGETKEKLNELIYDLYELNILDINRIKHFFTRERDVNKSDLEKYQEALYQTIQLFFENEPVIEYYQGTNLPFGLVGVVIYFDDKRNDLPSVKKTLQYKINEILHTTNEKLSTIREKIYGNNCIYIIKNNSFHSWTTTKAFEDGKEILKKLIR